MLWMYVGKGELSVMCCQRCTSLFLLGAALNVNC
jgi:hypothetical protein